MGKLTNGPARMFCLTPGLALAVWGAASSVEAQMFEVDGGRSATVRSADDYAAETLGDPWDFDQRTDHVYMLSHGSWDGIPAVSGGIFRGVTTADAGRYPRICLLFEGMPGAANLLDRTGMRYPIDTNRFSRLSFRMRRSAPAREHEPIVVDYYPDVPAADHQGLEIGLAAGIAEGPDGRRMLNQSPVADQRTAGWHIYRLDLDQRLLDSNFSSGPAWNATGVARGLGVILGWELPAGTTIEIDWFRLSERLPASERLPLAWSNMGGRVTLTAQHAQTGDRIQIYPDDPAEETFPATDSLAWDYGYLPPGQWEVTARAGGTSRSVTVRIRPAPVVTVLDPDVGGGRDFAETMLADGWDMTNRQDVFRYGHLGDIGDHAFGEDGLTATTSGGDSRVVIADEFRGDLVIDADRFHRVTFTLEFDQKALMLQDSLTDRWGGLARVIWREEGSTTGDFSQTRGLLMYDGGPTTYSFDLKELRSGPGGRFDITMCGPPTCRGAHPWRGRITNFRIDPYEAQAPRWFRLSNVRLAEDDQPNANGFFTVRWNVSHARLTDGAGNAASARVNLYRAASPSPDATKTPIASGLSAAAGEYRWHARGLPPGRYYIYVEVVDAAGHRTGRFSSGPLRVGGGYPSFEEWLTAHGLTSGTADEDGDGLDNRAEYELGTDPHVPNRWVFSEGATGFFETRLAVANPLATPAEFDVTFVRETGPPVRRRYGLDPHARATIPVNEIAGLGEATFGAAIATRTGAVVAERTMFAGADRRDGHTVKAVAGAGRRWFLAEGFAGDPFHTFVLFANTSARDATVDAFFLLDAGGELRHRFTLPARSRRTIYTNDLVIGGVPLRNRAFSLRAESSAPITVERSMYVDIGPFGRIAHASAAVDELSEEWFVAEGRTGPWFSMFLLLANPNPTAVAASVRYLTPGGQMSRRYDLAPHSRRTILVDNEPGLADTEVSAAVTATGPIMVERAMYWPDELWRGAHNSVGVTRPATRWALAEGELGGPQHFSSFLLLANPGTRAASVGITVLRRGGLAPIRLPARQVAAGARVTLSADHWQAHGLSEGERFGLLVESSEPVVVERAMYWNGAGELLGGGTNETGIRLRD